MKFSIKTVVALFSIIALFTGPVSASLISDDLNRKINSAVSSGSNIIVTEHNGVVTLTGYFSDAGDKNAARAVLYSKGVKQVIDNTTTSS